jgi:hypothetical protein
LYDGEFGSDTSGHEMLALIAFGQPPQRNRANNCGVSQSSTCAHVRRINSGEIHAGNDSDDDAAAHAAWGGRRPRPSAVA